MTTEPEQLEPRERAIRVTTAMLDLKQKKEAAEAVLAEAKAALDAAREAYVAADAYLRDSLVDWAAEFGIDRQLGWEAEREAEWRTARPES